MGPKLLDDEESPKRDDQGKVEVANDEQSNQDEETGSGAPSEEEEHRQNPETQCAGQPKSKKNMSMKEQYSCLTQLKDIYHQLIKIHQQSAIDTRIICRNSSRPS
jgi:hypothetical protein